MASSDVCPFLFPPVVSQPPRPRLGSIKSPEKCSQVSITTWFYCGKKQQQQHTHILQRARVSVHLLPTSLLLLLDMDVFDFWFWPAVRHSCSLLPLDGGGCCWTVIGSSHRAVRPASLHTTTAALATRSCFFPHYFMSLSFHFISFFLNLKPGAAAWAWNKQPPHPHLSSPLPF